QSAEQAAHEAAAARGAAVAATGAVARAAVAGTGAVAGALVIATVAAPRAAEPAEDAEQDDDADDDQDNPHTTPMEKGPARSRARGIGNVGRSAGARPRRHGWRRGVAARDVAAARARADRVIARRRRLELLAAQVPLDRVAGRVDRLLQALVVVLLLERVEERRLHLGAV